MAKITQKQLEYKIKTLKEIKPRKEWAVLLKAQILSENRAPEAVRMSAQKTGILEVLGAVFFQRKLAYSVVAFAFVVVGLVGFAQYTVPGDALFPIKKLSESSQAGLLGQTALNREITSLSNRVNDLAQVAKDGKTANIPSAIVEIEANAGELARNIKDNPVQDQAQIKEIASALKVLAQVQGTDLSENSEIKDLYQTVVSAQIEDYKKMTLTDAQKEALLEAEELYKQEKYADALEKLLLIGQAEEIETASGPTNESTSK